MCSLPHPPLSPQELGRNNPQLIQLIQGNQEDFLRMLQEPPGEGELVRAGQGEVVGQEGTGREKW